MKNILIGQSGGPTAVINGSLYGAIIFTWYWLHKKNPKVVFQYTKNSVYKAIADNHEDLKKYAEMLKIIK